MRSTKSLYWWFISVRSCWTSPLVAGAFESSILSLSIIRQKTASRPTKLLPVPGSGGQTARLTDAERRSSVLPHLFRQPADGEQDAVEQGFRARRAAGDVAVSYTHLTLPTILRGSI